MARTSAALVESLPRDQLEAIVLQVRRARSVRVRALGLGKLSRTAEAELLAAVGRAGLEHTGQAIRVPLAEQVRDVVAGAGEQGVTQAELALAVQGARNTAELQLAARGLIRARELAVVIEGPALRLCRPGPELLSEPELEQLDQLANTLSIWRRATKPPDGEPRPTLRRSAVSRALASMLTKAHGAARQEGEALVAAVRAAFLVAPAAAGLVRVPDVIGALERVHSRLSLVRTTEALAREGLLELRPEASIAGISDEDRARCPLALDGTPLSYARRVGDLQGGTV